LRGEELFRTVATGHITGAYAVAIPSSDGKLHLPNNKRGDWIADSPGILVGRAPYDKPNLRPIDSGQVGGEDDVTVKFLNEGTAIQYSFVGAEPARGGQTSEAPMFFAKGILVVVPDEKWPEDYADRSVVFSAEDIKTHSDWTKDKNRHTSDTRLVATGILQATAVFGPGSLAAVPVDEHKKLDGDFDGDAVLLLGDRPALFHHVKEFERARKPFASLKPPKSHTAAVGPGGGYAFGRTHQILATTLGTLEIYSGLLQTYLAQSPDTRGWIAERSVFGTYEGLDPDLKTRLRKAIEHKNKDTSGQVLMADLDEELEYTRNPHAKKVIAELQDQVRAWRHDLAPIPRRTAQSSPIVTRSTGRRAAVNQSGRSGQLRKPLDDPGLQALLPRLREVEQARTAAERIEANLWAFPDRMPIGPTGYDPDDLSQTLANFLSLGIKVGTDAYKSDTATYAFKRTADRLILLFAAAPDLRRVPYAKAAARNLHAGRLDPDADRRVLKTNPTLVAGLMEAGLDFAERHDLLNTSSLPGDSPAVAQRRDADDRSPDHAQNAQAKEVWLTSPRDLRHLQKPDH
jgi:hypothetical protein